MLATQSLVSKTTYGLIGTKTLRPWTVLGRTRGSLQRLLALSRWLQVSLYVEIPFVVVGAYVWWHFGQAAKIVDLFSRLKRSTDVRISRGNFSRSMVRPGGIFCIPIVVMTVWIIYSTIENSQWAPRRGRPRTMLHATIIRTTSWRRGLTWAKLFTKWWPRRINKNYLRQTIYVRATTHPNQTVYRLLRHKYLVQLPDEGFPFPIIFSGCR